MGDKYVVHSNFVSFSVMFYAGMHFLNLAIGFCKMHYSLPEQTWFGPHSLQMFIPNKVVIYYKIYDGFSSDKPIASLKILWVKNAFNTPNVLSIIT